MGGPAQTMVAQLIAFNINTQLDWGLAAALSVVVLAATLLVFALFQAVFGLDRLAGQGTNGGRSGAGFNRAARGRSQSGWVVAGLGVLVVALLLAPGIVGFPVRPGSSPFTSLSP